MGEGTQAICIMVEGRIETALGWDEIARGQDDQEQRVLCQICNIVCPVSDLSHPSPLPPWLGQGQRSLKGQPAAVQGPLRSMVTLALGWEG